jgi:hypothetical protein
MQEIRVIPITRRMERIISPDDPQARIDATVTTTDLTDGSIRYWSHVLEELRDGSFGHVFRTQMHVLPNHRYRLEVRRSDGRVATAETTIPVLSNAEVIRSAPTVFGDSVHQEIRLVGVSSPWNITMMYRLNPGVAIARGRSGHRDGEDWVFEVNVDRDIHELAERFLIASDELRFEGMGVNATVMDDQWVPPGDVFDAEVLAQPGAFTNVTNGYGFFGSTGLLQVDWVISDELVAALGW